MDNGDIPAPYDRWGARLLAHLTKPVQVVVTGMERSGKSALIEMMSAQPVLGAHRDVPITELAYGKNPRTVFEREDGSTTALAGFLKDCKCPQDAIRVRQELPDPLLIRQNYVEIGLSGDASQKRTMLEAVKARADIIIWCSQDFSDEERQLWASVPDQIKDHSFLVLTMADHQLMRGVLTTTINRLAPIVTDEFMGLYPVATIQGITAQTVGGSLNQTLWAASGGKQLMDMVLRQIKQGRTADIDQARIFMDRLEICNRVAEINAVPPSTPSLSEPDTNLSQTQGLKEDERSAELWSDAIDLLQDCADKILDTLDVDGELDADAILNSCTEALSSLAELLDEDDAGDPAAQAVRDDVQEGGEMLMLFQLERGEEAALDAVTLLLQLRKELIDQVAGS